MKNGIRKRCHFYICKIFIKGYRDANFMGQTLIVDISDNQNHKTSNLPGTLNVCIGTRVILIANINTSDCLMNGSIEKIEYMQMSRAENGLFGIIYVSCVNLDAVISVKKKVFKRLIEGFFTNYSYYLNISVLLQE